MGKISGGLIRACEKANIGDGPFDFEPNLNPLASRARRAQWTT
jgi:hypothetical protein